MARLRIRIELNRGGVGVPLHKLAHVIDEAQKFFHMLAEDVRVDETKGEWLGFDFDHESLNFTAEFVGPVTPEQVQAFNAAFDGTTPLRRATIGQFARITDSIEEDEVIGFGLYQAEASIEPTDWRALSRRDALRIAGEIQVLANAELAGAAGAAESVPNSLLPAVAHTEDGGRIFSERRERGVETRKWVSFVREIEATLSKRISHVETGLDEHAGLIQDLRTKTTATEDSMVKVLGAVEKFCNQTTKQVEAISRPKLVVPKWVLGTSVAALSVLIIAGLLLWSERPAESVSPPAPAPAVASTPTPAPPPAVAEAKPPATTPVARSAPSQAGSSTLEIEASEPTWVSVTAADGQKLISRLFVPGDSRKLDLTGLTTLRAGNAGGLSLRLNGEAVQPIGGHGEVRDVIFNNGSYKVRTP